MEGENSERREGFKIVRERERECLPRDLEGSKSQQDQEHKVLPSRIQALFVFPNSQISIVFGSPFRDDSRVMIG